MSTQTDSPDRKGPGASDVDDEATDQLRILYRISRGTGWIAFFLLIIAVGNAVSSYLYWKQLGIIRDQLDEMKSLSEKVQTSFNSGTTQSAALAKAIQSLSEEIARGTKAKETAGPAPVSELTPSQPPAQPPAREAPRVEVPRPRADVPAPRVEIPRVEIPRPRVEAPQAVPQVQAPAAETPRAATPQATTPQITIPQLSIPQVARPQVVRPQVATPQVATPQVATPQVATPQVATPQVQPSRVEPARSEPARREPPPSEVLAFALSRPWIGVDAVPSERLRQNRDFKINVDVRNAGKSPALNVRAEFKTVIRAANDIAVPDITPCTKCTSLVLLPDASMTYDAEIDSEDLSKASVRRIRSGNTVLLLFGRIDYVDVLNAPHVTKVCMMFAPKFSEFRACPQGTYFD